jgi:NAD(P)-dependent dehydrogenase (short-subunit alcohol dehydrogenase family)
VVVVDINAELGAKASKELEVGFFQADLTQLDQVTNLASDIQHQYGRIDIAFNNAGVCVNVPSEECSGEDWRRVIDINLNAVFYCCREFGKVMLKQGKGSIINTASMSGIISNTPQPQSAYNASKAAVIMLTKSLAGEWASRGVRVNAIAPGYIGTEMTKIGMSNESWYKVWKEMTPMGRVGEPREVAAPVVFLASDASSYFTGSVLTMDGGYTCW